MRPQLSPERARLTRLVARACPLASSVLALLVPAQARAQSRVAEAVTVRVRVVETVPAVSVAARSDEGRLEITVAGDATVQVDGGPAVEIDAGRPRTVGLPPVSNSRAAKRAPRLVRVRIET